MFPLPSPFLLLAASKIAITPWASCFDSSSSHPSYNQVSGSRDMSFRSDCIFDPIAVACLRTDFSHAFSIPPVSPLSLQTILDNPLFSLYLHQLHMDDRVFHHSLSCPNLETSNTMPKQADVTGDAISQPSRFVFSLCLCLRLSPLPPFLPLLLLFLPFLLL